MNTIDAIHSRRAIKHFDLHHQMPAKTVNDILALAMLSPTAFNIQQWRFTVVDDAVLRQEIRRASMDQAQVTDASLFIVLCADLKAWQKKPLRYWNQAPADVQDFMLPAMDQYYRDKPQVQRDEAMRSCGIAAQTLMLAAQSFGYDSCPMDGFDFEQVARLIQLPSDHVIAMFIAIGKASQAAWPRAGQLMLNDVVIKNRFKQ